MQNRADTDPAQSGEADLNTSFKAPKEEASKLGKMARNLAMLGALTLPALGLMGCVDEDGQSSSSTREPTPATRTIDDDSGGPTFGITTSGKPGIMLDDGISIGIDMDGNVGIGFGF